MSENCTVYINLMHDFKIKCIDPETDAAGTSSNSRPNERVDMTSFNLNNKQKITQTHPSAGTRLLASASNSAGGTVQLRFTNSTCKATINPLAAVTYDSLLY